MDDNNGWAYGLFLLVALAVLVAGAYGLGNWECSTKAEGLGLPWNYSIIAGCRVEIEPGLLAPLDNVRWIPGTGFTIGD